MYDKLKSKQQIYMKKIEFYAPQTQVDQLNNYCTQRDLPRAQVIREAVENYLNGTFTSSKTYNSNISFHSTYDIYPDCHMIYYTAPPQSTIRVFEDRKGSTFLQTWKYCSTVQNFGYWDNISTVKEK